MRYWMLVVLGLLVVPMAAFAANTGFFGPVVPECIMDSNSICQACDLMSTAENLLRVFISLAIGAASLMFAYAGILYVTAAANQGNIDSAKTVFINTLIGLVLILCAYLIVDLVMRAFTGQSLNVLTKVDCIKVEHPEYGFKYTRVPRSNPAPPVSGTQGGTPSTQCTAGTGMTHDQALTMLAQCGVSVTSTSGDGGVSGTCSGSGCTNLSGICKATLTGVCELAKTCPVTVWGGTEVGPHAPGGTHERGLAVDVNNSQCIGDWLNKNIGRYGVRSICAPREETERYGWKPCKTSDGKDYYEVGHYHINFSGGG